MNPDKKIERNDALSPGTTPDDDRDQDIAKQIDSKDPQHDDENVDSPASDQPSESDTLLRGRNSISTMSGG